MITAFVQITLPEALPRDDVIAIFEASVPNYKGVHGLLRKYYLYDSANRVGGFYIWEDRALAEALHTPEWLKHVGDRYDSVAEITYFEAPILVDNE